MTRPRHRDLVRLQSYVDPALAERVERFCASSGISESALLRSCLVQYLDGTSDMSLLLRRLDRLGRTLERQQRDLELLSEAFGVYVRLWFAHLPLIPEDRKKAVRDSAENRYGQYVEHVGRRFSGGHRFLDDLPRESLADESELAAIASKGGGVGEQGKVDGSSEIDAGE